MTSIICFYINLSFVLMTIIVLPGAVKIDNKNRGNHLFAALFVNLILWQVMETATFVVQDHTWLRYLYDLKFLPVGAVIVLFFILIMRFFRMGKYFSWFKIVLLSTIPVITVVLAFTTTQHELLRSTFEVLSTYPLLDVVTTRGVWVDVQLCYYALLMAVVFVLAIYKFCTLPKVYRMGAFWIIILIAFGFSGCIFGLINRWVPYLDFFLIGMYAACFIFYIVNTVNDRPDYLLFERKEIFNYLSEAIFILNKDDIIMDANKYGARELEYLGVKDLRQSLTKILKALQKSGKIVLKDAQDGNGTDIIIPSSGFSTIYNMRKYDIDSKDPSSSGYTVIITDVTNNRLAIEYFCDLAGIDSLTGVYNRFYYTRLLKDLDTAENLPLSVILGDVNGLKEANDKYGHEYGDRLLKAIASVLVESCPSDGVVVRLGGDEFIILLPCRTKKYAEDLIINIKNNMAEKTILSKSSIALGCATKSVLEYSINQLFNEADANMYLNKTR